MAVMFPLHPPGDPYFINTTIFGIPLVVRWYGVIIVGGAMLAGRIAAGLPVETAENLETISLRDVVGNKDVFALEVRGDSMRDEHIINGDYVLVERARTARQGEIVVALVHGSETTLKRFYSEGHMVRLQPANTEMEPIFVPAAQVAIQGRVLGVLRKYQ